MKQVITSGTKEFISMSLLTGREIVAYRCQNSVGYAMLAKLNGANHSERKRYGFVPLGSSDSNPRFEGESFFDCIEKASKNRKIMVFESMSGFVEAMYKKAF